MHAKQLIEFLTELSHNNTRDWFETNKKNYQESRIVFEHIVEYLILEITKFDPSIASVSSKECIFRINRDVRFSTNKEPYKTHFGAFIAFGGRKSVLPGYYLHIEPEKTFAGGGLFMPQPDYLQAIRSEIYHNTDEFRDIILNKQFIATYGGLSLMGDELKTAPRGFPKNWEDIDLLKFRHYTCGKHFNNVALAKIDFSENVLTAFKHLLPLNSFLSNAVKEVKEQQGL